MELNLNQRKSALEEKIPDMRKTLSVVEYMIARVSITQSALMVW